VARPLVTWVPSLVGSLQTFVCGYLDKFEETRARKARGIIMSHFERVWLGMLTRSTKYSGTNSRIVLIVNEDGHESLHHTFPDTSQDDQEQGEANLYELDVATQTIEPQNLGNSSVRVGIRGADMWKPEHVVLWGEQLTGGAILPVGIETDIETSLSTDQTEGNISIPVRSLALGTDRMRINRLLMLMSTKKDKHAGTNSPIELQVSVGGAIVVDFDIPDTPQQEQERAQANLYFVPVNNPFTKGDLTNNSITLRIKGADMWTPASFFLFGLDDARGRPESMVPLVHEPTWPHGSMSTDSSEGDSSVTLTLA